MAGELFKSMSGTYLVHIPYKGSSGARTDLLGGQVDLMFDAVTTMVEQVKSGKVKAIATTGKQRSVVLPDVPTVHESGVPGFDVSSWNGLGVPAKTPRPVIDRLNRALNEALASSDVKQRLQEQAVDTFPSTPDAYRKHIAAEIAKWTKVIDTAKIPKQ